MEGGNGGASSGVSIDTMKQGSMQDDAPRVEPSEDKQEQERLRLAHLKADEEFAWKLAREDPSFRPFTRSSRRASASNNNNTNNSTTAPPPSKQAKPKSKAKPKVKSNKYNNNNTKSNTTKNKANSSKKTKAKHVAPEVLKKQAAPKNAKATKRKSQQVLERPQAKKQRTASRPPSGSASLAGKKKKNSKSSKGPPKRSRKVTCASASASGSTISISIASASSSVPSTRRSEIATNNNNNNNNNVNDTTTIDNINIDLGILPTTTTNHDNDDRKGAGSAAALVVEESVEDDGECGKTRGWKRAHKDKRYAKRGRRNMNSHIMGSFTEDVVYGKDEECPKIKKRMHEDEDVQFMLGRHGLSEREKRQMSRHYARDLVRAGITSDCVQLNPLGNRAKKTAVRPSAIHGLGLFAEEDIEEGEFVVEFVGERIRQAVANVRERTYERSGMGDNYLFALDADTVIDATKKGCNAKYINHHCSPNVYVKRTKVRDEVRLVFYALKKITREHEITYDYRYAKEPDTHKIKCLCNAQNCLGTLN